MATCSFENCTNKEFEQYGRCILHLSESEIKSINWTDELYETFYAKFINYLAIELFNSQKELQDRNHLDESPESAKKRRNSEIEQFENVLKRKSSNNNSKTIISNFYIVIVGVSFPIFDDIFFKKIQYSLYDFKSISFYQCIFFNQKFRLNNKIHEFNKCKMISKWELEKGEKLKYEKYIECDFSDDIRFEEKNKIKIDFNNPLFINCTFEHNLEINNAAIKNTLFDNSSDHKTVIGSLIFKECIIEEKFVLNKAEIGYYKNLNSEFKNKFEFKNNKINTFEIDNTNFRKLVDCYKSKFSSFSISKSIFDDFVGFEDCKFGNDKAIEVNTNAAKFNYATFMSFVNFRDAYFYNGIDFRNSNLKETPNFLDATIPLKNTNRETFRIIKNSFDKVGNYIEGNRFYEFEMQKYNEELKAKGDLPGSLILLAYKFTSNYGQSFIRPIAGIFITAFIYGFIISNQNTLEYFNLFFPWFYTTIEFIFNCLNNVTKHIIPFKNILKEGLEFTSLIFYIIFSSLIWLTILAIKRKTKR